MNRNQGLHSLDCRTCTAAYLHCWEGNLANHCTVAEAKYTLHLIEGNTFLNAYHIHIELWLRATAETRGRYIGKNLRAQGKRISAIRGVTV